MMFAPAMNNDDGIQESLDRVSVSRELTTNGRLAGTGIHPLMIQESKRDEK